MQLSRSACVLLLGIAISLATYTSRTAYVCEVSLPNFSGPSPPKFSFAAGGGSYSIGKNFNALSFNSFTNMGGDVEGRVAVRYNFSAPSGGFTIGYQLQTTTVDESLPFGLVVGGNARWSSGSIFPEGTSQVPGTKENIYVGGTFTAPTYLTSRRTGGPSNALDSQFAAAKTYYIALSNAFAARTDNAKASITYGGIALDCTGASSATSYSATFDGAQWNTANYFASFTNCNPNAQYIFNIGGTSSTVEFKGGSVNLNNNNKILYNVLGSGRTILVSNEIRGSVLAPDNNLNQPQSGVVKGLVIVGNVQSSLQFNWVHCDCPQEDDEDDTPATTAKLTTQPLTTKPLTTAALTTKPLTTRAMTTQQLTTKSLTTQPLTTRALTTKPLTTQELTTQPLTTQELTTQPLTTQPLTTKPLTTQPLTTQALTTKPLTTRPLTTQPLTTQPLTTQELTTSPLTTQPLTTQPLTTQPLTTQPLTTQELTTQPLTTQPLTTKPLTTQELTTQPLTTQALTTQELTTQPLTTQPLTTQPLTTQELTTQPLTTQPLTTQPLTTQALTTKPLTTQPLTTQPLTTQPLTTSPLTTQALTTQPLTTQPLTTQPLTTQPLTTQELTTQPLTTQPLTTAPLTTQPLTTQPLTTQPLTTQPLTTQELTTSPLTTQELTTQPLTTQALTTQPLTTSPLTTQPLTTQALTTQPLTTQALTTQPLTTQALTTQPLTTSPLTTQPLTTSPLTTQPLTTQALTTQPLTTQPLTTQPLTTQELTTSPLTTQELTTSPLTTQELTTSPLTTQELTTSPLTTQELTTAPLTTQALTTAPLTTAEITSGAITSGALTTAALTTGVMPPPYDVYLCYAWFEPRNCAGYFFALEDHILPFGDYDVISFDSFYANTGDTEGRVAVRNNFVVGAGFSVGALVDNMEQNPYSLIIGRDMTWGSGAILPIGSVMYVGGQTTAPGYLADSVVNQPCPGCTDGVFDAARDCYRDVTTNLASQPINALATLLPTTGGEMHVTCLSEDDDTYYIHIDTASFNQITFYTLHNCNNESRYVITITGNEDIDFKGQDFPQTGGTTVYVIPGTRNVLVEVNVGGSILGPDVNLRNTGGTVIGKVVVGNVATMIQFNRNTCIYEGSSKRSRNTMITYV